MGSGMGPMKMAARRRAPARCSTRSATRPARQYPKGADCFKDNRATLHLHGGITPWISDGTPHQWITPANENTPWPRGVSVENVPDMVGTGKPAKRPRLLGREERLRDLLLHQPAERPADVLPRPLVGHHPPQRLRRRGSRLPDQRSDGEEADRQRDDPGPSRFRSSSRTARSSRTRRTSAKQDPTWNASQWGGEGNLWYHHVYMPAQNPGDPSGMSSFGRWMYGPWFWPPATRRTGRSPTRTTTPAATSTTRRPGSTSRSLLRAQADPGHAEHLDRDGAVQRHAHRQRDCVPDHHGRPEGLPLPDPERLERPLLEPAVVRGRPHHGNDERGCAETGRGRGRADRPNVFPTPDTSGRARPGRTGSRSARGRVPAGADDRQNQPITFITDPTRFDVGNVDQHSLLLAPAERADVIVDFSHTPARP